MLAPSSSCRSTCCLAGSSWSLRLGAGEPYRGPQPLLKLGRNLTSLPPPCPPLSLYCCPVLCPWRNFASRIASHQEQGWNCWGQTWGGLLRLPSCRFHAEPAPSALQPSNPASGVSKSHRGMRSKHISAGSLNSLVLFLSPLPPPPNKPQGWGWRRTGPLELSMQMYADHI